MPALIPHTSVLPHRHNMVQHKLNMAGLQKHGMSATGKSHDQFVTLMDDQRKQVERAKLVADDAFSQYSVLITGETGTGKDILAKIAGKRYDKIDGVHQPAPYLVANCGGFVDTLFESELFGHIKGSFTGAHADKVGLLEAAGNGTVFLDEVGDLPLQQQVKLLRAIENKTITRVGEPLSRNIYCRFVFATNRNLPLLIRQNKFREDLYYRIAQLPIRTWPLRERPDDVMPIARALIDRNDWTPLEEDENLLCMPFTYNRGNVRQLERCLLLRELGDSWDDIKLIVDAENDDGRVP